MILSAGLALWTEYKTLTFCLIEEFGVGTSFNLKEGDLLPGKDSVLPDVSAGFHTGS